MFNGQRSMVYSCLWVYYKSLMSGIYNLSRTQTTTPNTTVPQSASSNLNINDDSLLDADDSESFDLRNQIFQLRTKCNNLEYDKSKLSISYENTINELQKKYAILQELMAKKSEKEDSNGMNTSQLLNKCQFLSEENEQLKKEMQANIQKNRITPNFNAPELAEDMAALAFLQKPENIAQLEKAYEHASKQELEDLRNKLGKLEKEHQKKEKEYSGLEKQNQSLKEQLARVESEKEETLKLMTQETEEHHIKTVKFKDRTIEELKQEQISLNLQLTQSKKLIGQLSSNQTDANQQQKNLKLLATQLRQKQAKIVELEQQVNRLQMEGNRIRSERSKVEQQVRYYENEKKEVQSKRKMLQQELYKKENEYSEAKNSWFNEKMQIKKQFNSSKYQIEEEVSHLKSVIEAKEQQNKRLKESIVAVYEQNQSLKQKVEAYMKKIEKMNQEIISLNSNIEKLIAENEVSHNALKNKQKSIDVSQYERQIQILKQEMNKSKDQKIRNSVRLSEASKEQVKLEEELKHKEEIIQLLKIEMEERVAKERDFDRKLKELQTKNHEKDKVISKLQEEIKNLKFDNRQLQIANEELGEKVETLNKIKSDIENMNSQLKREKMHLSQKRKAEQKSRNEGSSPKFPLDKKLSKAFSTVSQVPKNGEPVDLFELADNHLNKLPGLSEKQSDEGKQMILELINQLKAENNQLQNRIGQVQNQLDKKAVDLSVKERQLKALKSKDHYKPIEVDIDPYIQTSKRNQFNAVFLQNKISELQKQIQSVKSMKEKELQEQRKVIRRQLQQKYLNEMKKQKAYIHQLEKQSNILHNKHDQSHKMIVSLKIKNEELEQQKYELELQLSSNLEELNTVLRKCKAYQSKCMQMDSSSRTRDSIIDQYKKIKTSYDYMTQKYERQGLMLKNANEQIRKLNDVLMVKEGELKSVSSRSSRSPNNSFLGVSKPEDQEYIIKGGEHQKSSEEDLVRVWAQRRSGPSFSRI